MVLNDALMKSKKLSKTPVKIYNAPLFTSKLQAGFPSPADDYIEKNLDLNTHLISHPSSTFFAHVTGDSMIDACIHHNDLVIVDKSIEAVSGKIVIAVVDGEFTIKRLKINAKKELYLNAENKDYSSIKLTENSYIWGVVTTVIRQI